MAFFVNGIFGYVVQPLLKVGPNVWTALSWVDYIRIGFTLLIGISTGSSLLEAYRMKLLRTELEDTAGGANSLLEDIRQFRHKARREWDGEIASVKTLLQDAGDSIEQARELQRTAQMMAEDIYELGARGEVMPEDVLKEFRELINQFQASNERMDRNSKALRDADC